MGKEVGVVRKLDAPKAFLTRKTPKGRAGVQQEGGKGVAGDPLSPLPNVLVLVLSSGALVFLAFPLQPPNSGPSQAEGKRPLWESLPTFSIRTREAQGHLCGLVG